VAEALAVGSVSGALLARREKIALLAAILAVAGVAWSYLVLSAAHPSMDGAAHAAMGMSSVPWTANTAVLTFMMWAVMMVAMMLPSAAPMVLTYAAVVGRVAPEQGKRSSVAVFAAAYLLVWLGFSLGATLLQWSLERAAVLSSTTMALGPLLGGGLLLVAGLYQLSPLVGLVPCTTPLESPQSNGMAEAFVRTLKRDYVRVSPVPDAETVLRQLPSWLAHYNQVHPHRALGYRSPREFIGSTSEGLSGN
jgi:predicted metal-binding membrane protein